MKSTATATYSSGRSRCSEAPCCSTIAVTAAFTSRTTASPLRLSPGSSVRNQNCQGAGAGKGIGGAAPGGGGAGGGGGNPARGAGGGGGRARGGGAARRAA